VKKKKKDKKLLIGIHHYFMAFFQLVDRNNKSNGNNAYGEGRIVSSNEI